MGELVPYLEDILTLEYKPGWKRLLEKLENYFDSQFDPEWKRKAGINYW